MISQTQLEAAASDPIPELMTEDDWDQFWRRSDRKLIDVVNHPEHYTSHKSGIECIQITEHMNFTLGNAMKYLWRADLKNGTEDLKKAVWYIQRELAKREKEGVSTNGRA